jgi:hypothetical protein
MIRREIEAAEGPAAFPGLPGRPETADGYTRPMSPAVNFIALRLTEAP